MLFNFIYKFKVVQFQVIHSLTLAATFKQKVTLNLHGNSSRGFGK